MIGLGGFGDLAYTDSQCKGAGMGPPYAKIAVPKSAHVDTTGDTLEGEMEGDKRGRRSELQIDKVDLRKYITERKIVAMGFQKI